MTSESDNIPERAEDPELSAAFARGDFRRVRARARALLQEPSSDRETRAVARRFYVQVSADVVVYVMLAFALAVFCAIVLRYALH